MTICKMNSSKIEHLLDARAPPMNPDENFSRVAYSTHRRSTADIENIR